MTNSKNQPSENLIPFLRTKEFYVKKSAKYYQQNQISKAISFLQKAVTIKPYDIETNFQLATYLGEQGNFHEANKHLLLILEKLDSSMTICLYYLGVNYAQLGLFTEAAEYLEKYLEEDLDLDFEEEAIEILTMIEDEATFSLLEYEDECIVKLEEGRSFISEGQLEEAINIFKSIIEEHPQFWPAYNNLAVALFHLEKTEEALEVTFDVLEKSEGNIHAYCNVVIFLYFSGQTKEAIEWAEKLRKVTSLFDEQTAKIGATFGIIGLYKESYQVLKPLFYRGYYGEPAFYYWLAVSSEYIGNSHFAKTVWARYVEEYPDKKGQEPWEKENKKKEDEFFYVSILYEVLRSVQLKDYENVEVLKGFLKNKNLPSPLFEFLSNGPHYLDDSWENKIISLYDNYCLAEMDEDKQLSFTGFIFPILPILKMNYEKVTNIKAVTAAIDYLIHTINDDKVTYKSISEKYNLAPVTVSKYVKKVVGWMEEAIQ